MYKIISLIVCIHMFWSCLGQEINEQTFDFWVGQWEVSWKDTDNTIIVAQNSIKKILDDKAIQEDFFDPNTNLKGKSLSIFNHKTKTWHQTWVDNQGAHYNFIGAIENGNPVFKTKMIERDGKKIIMKMVFENIEKNKFIWEWMGTKDGGENWDTLWKINYKRKTELNQLEDVYDQFERFVKSNQIDSLQNLFVNVDVPLNTVIRMPDSLLELSNPLSNWLGFLKKATLPYELKITNSNYVIAHQLAYAIADYDEYVNSNHQAIGKDLFFYLKTENGWKLASLNGTASLVSNANAIETADLTKAKVEDVVIDFLTHLKVPNGSINNYVAKHSIVAYKDGHNSLWMLKSLTDIQTSDFDKVHFNFDKMKTQIIDRHLALIKVEYLTKAKSENSGTAYLCAMANNLSNTIITSLFFDNH